MSDLVFDEAPLPAPYTPEEATAFLNELSALSRPPDSYTPETFPAAIPGPVAFWQKHAMQWMRSFTWALDRRHVRSWLGESLYSNWLFFKMEIWKAETGSKTDESIALFTYDYHYELLSMMTLYRQFAAPLVAGYIASVAAGDEEPMEAAYRAIGVHLRNEEQDNTQ